jgi:hypothetical protein
VECGRQPPLAFELGNAVALPSNQHDCDAQPLDFNYLCTVLGSQWFEEPLQILGKSYSDFQCAVHLAKILHEVPVWRED